MSQTKLTHSAWRPAWRPAFRSLLVVLLATSAVTSIHAKRVRNEASTLAYVQFWDLCPVGTPPISGSISGGEVSAGQEFSPLTPGTASGYTALRPATYQFKLNAGNKPIAPITIKADKMTWTTVLLKLDDKGAVVAEVIDDTYDFKPETPGSVMVYNFTKGGIISCSLPGQQPYTLASYGSSQRFGNITSQSAQINTILKTANSDRIRSGELPITLTECKRWAIVFSSNEQGRIRSKMLRLGYNAPEFTEFVEVPDDVPATGSPVPVPTP